MGESLIRRPLQPEATGAVMELTKWLKPSVWLVTYRGWRECAGCDASERRASMSWWQPSGLFLGDQSPAVVRYPRF
jgi:hypothetical protein